MCVIGRGSSVLDCTVLFFLGPIPKYLKMRCADPFYSEAISYLLLQLLLPFGLPSLLSDLARYTI